MGMGALGRAFAKGVSGAATAGAGMIYKEHEREQEFSNRASLQDLQNQFNEKLDLQRQKFTGDQAGIGREHELTVLSKRQEFEGGQTDKKIAAEDKRSTDERAAALERTRIQEGGANSRAALANAIAEERNRLDRQKVEFDQAGALDPSSRAEAEFVSKEMTLLNTELNKLDPMSDDFSARTTEIRGRMKDLSEQGRALFSRGRADRSAWGSEGRRGAIPAAERASNEGKQRKPFVAPTID